MHQNGVYLIINQCVLRTSGLPGCLAPGRQYGNALLGVRHQEEEVCGLKKLLIVLLNACMGPTGFFLAVWHCFPVLIIIATEFCRYMEAWMCCACGFVGIIFIDIDKYSYCMLNHYLEWETGEATCSRLLPNGIVARPGNRTRVTELEFEVR